ncbi:MULTISPECIES: DUF4276 family protein [Dethiosulfovibrio]|uniref:DUF4276 family protein n=2 Tax=Dethiosulfovibrio TaxID=47054 RepID=A0ABS9EN49_9BACT|nr:MULTISPECIES: DUF4276 family protein [Dethiosulfovibrio]MCF4114220.1 DUF4276 family protein [Dethiosulfovibrio russensis]MCF4142590.1 DUF4276 family protein [Dethiosulfovibrio marinus]MCF4145109.1 DUF4276 family protein [Dethiosulfovibrio acidaminovorans]
MNDYIEVVAIVEGQTELAFIKYILREYLSTKNIFITPIMTSKPGQKGGDVKFARVKRDISHQLKQRKDTFLTTFIDFYGIDKKWPGVDKAVGQTTPSIQAKTLNDATKREIGESFPDLDSDRRFIPYVSIHEFEALLFSDTEVLSKHIGVSSKKIDKIIGQCKEPERVNNSPDTAPSKRLKKLSSRFQKTTTGIAIAKEIGIPKMRKKCPVFNAWLSEIESLR